MNFNGFVDAAPAPGGRFCEHRGLSRETKDIVGSWHTGPFQYCVGVVPDVAKHDPVVAELGPHPPPLLMGSDMTVAYMTNHEQVKASDLICVSSDIKQLESLVRLDTSSDRPFALYKYQAALQTMPYSKRVPLWKETCTIVT